jgi:amino acid permease
MWGPKGKIIVDIAMFIAQFSCCVGYLYFIAGLLSDILREKADFDKDRTFYIYLLLIPSIPISLIKTYTYLSYVSMFGILGATIGGFMMIGTLANKLSTDSYSHTPINWFDVSSIFSNIGITIFVFEGNGVVINLRAEAKNKKKYPFLLRMAILTIITWYMILATISYVTFRSDIKEYVTSNLELNAFHIVIITLFCINALASYPI